MGRALGGKSVLNVRTSTRDPAPSCEKREGVAGWWSLCGGRNKKPPTQPAATIHHRRGIFLKFRPREREISKFGLPKASTLRGPLCVPWCSGCYLARSCRCFGDLASPCDALVVGPSWQSPSMPSSLQFLAEQGSCWSAPDCELRVTRGTGMAAEVAVLVSSSVE